MTSNSTVPSQPIPTSSSSAGGNASSISAIPSSSLSNGNVGPDSLATLEETRQATISPPIDPSKLNNQPAPLPSPPSSSNHLSTSPVTHTEANTTSTTTVQPLRSPNNDTSGIPSDSAYLDQGMPIEPSSHPTIAETGVLAQSPDGNPGPKQGQLKRVEKPTNDEGIIKLGSLGGEGLKLKPPTESPSN